MPRPKKPPAERRTARINPRFTPAERIRVEEAALLAGISAAEYARAQILQGRVIIRAGRALAPEVLDQLRRIGVNLNQLARIANQTGALPPELARACTMIEAFLARELGGPAPHAQQAAPAAPAHGWTMPEPVTVRADGS
jgi:hypothetical protein